MNSQKGIKRAEGEEETVPQVSGSNADSKRECEVINTWNN